MITVDPARDTVANIGPALARLHPDFVGLTGTEAQLDYVFKLYKVSREKIFDNPEYGAVFPIFSHGRHIYLLDAEGRVLTLLPPILSLPQAQQIVAKYLGSCGACSSALTGLPRKGGPRAKAVVMSHP